MNRKSYFLSFCLCIGLILVLTSCQAAPPPPVETTTPVPATEVPTAVPTPIPPTKTPEPLPTATEAPKILDGSEQPIKILGYSILITYNGLIDIGYNPSGDSITTALSFSITEDSGKLDEVIALGGLITDREGTWLSNAFMEHGTNYKDETYVVYNILTTEVSGEYFLRFPSGEIIDLTPLMK